MLLNLRICCYFCFYYRVLIPLNRVIVIECFPIVKNEVVGNNVLIPLNRVIVIEFIYTTKTLCLPMKSLNPLKSGHCYWILLTTNLWKEFSCLNPLKSGHCYWMCYNPIKMKKDGLIVLIPLNRVIVIEYIESIKFFEREFLS